MRLSIVAITCGALLATSTLSSVAGPTLKAAGARPSIGVITSKPYAPKCASGFKMSGMQKVQKAGVQVVAKYGCQTAWFSCPKNPNFPAMNFSYKWQSQGTGFNQKVRALYTCAAYDVPK